ncbi:HD domain-containing protein [Entamoeba marina]
MVHNMNYNLQDRINRKKIYGGDYSCDDRIDSNDLKLIEIAGLCHDLGHGPHSHLYERMMKKRGIDFCHEEQSVKLFKKIVDENCIDLTESEIKMIGSIITDNGVPDWENANYYIRRDSHHLDIPTSFKSSDLINSSVLLNGRVCFLQDAQDSIEDMFTTRYSLYKKVYTHKDVTAVELLFTDLMLESYQYIDILKADPSDLYSFEQLDDSITNTIRYSTSYELSKAREIVKNLDQENYYKCVSEIKQDERNEHLLKNLNNENLSACISGLKPDDIIIDDQYLVVAKKGNWDDIPLVQSNTSKDSYFVEPSLLFPTENKSITRRIYARDSSKVDLVRNAVDSFVNNHSCLNLVLWNVKLTYHFIYFFLILFTESTFN